MNFNKVIILGNLTRDPESKVLPSGQSVVNFGVATNRFWRDAQGNNQQEAEFHNIVAFGRVAEVCSRFLRKGGLVLIEGRLRTRNWQDPNGQRRYRTEIIAENIQLGPKSGANANGNDNLTASAGKVKNTVKEEIPVINVDEEARAEDSSNQNQDNVNVDEIPF